MPLDVHRWVEDTRSHIAALQTPQGQIDKAVARLPLVTQIQTWSDAAAADDSQTLSRASTVVRECTAALEAVRAQQQRVRALALESEKLGAAVGKSSLFGSDDKRWRSFRAEIAKRLGRRRLDALRTLNSINLRTLRRSLDELTKEFGTSLDGATRAQLAMLSAARTAFAVGRLNSPQRVSGTAEDFVARGESELNAAEDRVWAALSRKNLELAGMAAAALAKSAGDLVEATASHASTVSARRGRSGAAVIDGPLALRFGQLLVALIQGCVLGEYVAFIVANGADTKQARRWIDAAQKRKLAPKHTERPLESIASLIARPTARADGSLITIEGPVVSMDELGDKARVVHGASVGDPSGAVLTVLVTNAPLETSGIVPGAYIRASGRWRSKFSATKRPALLLETSISTMTWDGWVSTELRAIVAPDPHAFAIATSWETGPDGAANRLRYGRWFVPALGT